MNFVVEPKGDGASLVKVEIEKSGLHQINLSLGDGSERER